MSSKNTGSTFDQFLKEEGINLDEARIQQVCYPVSNLIEALKQDKEYKQTWIANIAMAFQDEYNKQYRHKGVHEISNKAAENFINMLIKENTND